jgi:hypothetical protein
MLCSPAHTSSTVQCHMQHYCLQFSSGCKLPAAHMLQLPRHAMLATQMLCQIRTFLQATMLTRVPAVYCATAAYALNVMFIVSQPTAHLPGPWGPPPLPAWPCSCPAAPAQHYAPPAAQQSAPAASYVALAPPPHLRHLVLHSPPAAAALALPSEQ